MTTARSGWLPDVGADPEALIKEARRRLRLVRRSHSCVGACHTR